MKLKTLTSWKEDYEQPNNIQNKNYSLPTSPSNQRPPDFSMIIYGWGGLCEESWHWRIDLAFELSVEKTRRSQRTAGRSARSVLKEINLKFSLEGMMLGELSRWPPHAKGDVEEGSDSLEDAEREKKGRQEEWMAGWHLTMDESVDSGSWWCRTGAPGVLDSWNCSKVEYDIHVELNWATVFILLLRLSFIFFGSGVAPNIFGFSDSLWAIFLITRIMPIAHIFSDPQLFPALCSSWIGAELIHRLSVEY